MPRSGFVQNSRTCNMKNEGPCNDSCQHNTKTLPVIKTRSRVSFYPEEAQICCTMKPASSMTDAERSQTHWQDEDYELFRGTARIIASEILKISASQPHSGNAYDVVLTRAHQICSLDQVQEEKQNSSMPMTHDSQGVCLPPNLFAALTHWAKAGHSRRGLEKFCVPHHMQNRTLERQAVVQAVLLAQELLAETRRNVLLSGNGNEGKFRIGTWSFPLTLPDHEILRMVSERFTKTSRKFATAMGHADAAAVGKYEQPKV